MTQPARPDTVLGDFNDRRERFLGVESRFSREGDAFVIETLSPRGVIERFPIAMTVGSRRVQQYVTKIGDRHLRLPLAWDIREQRWLHLNAGFLHPDGSPFNEHLALWDANCIFCHNVKAKPGFDVQTRTFNASVEELGIACEACHGPGDEHVRRNANPIRRYLLHYTDRDDPTIISPRKLGKERQVQICGHCHGQRLPEPRSRIHEFASAGDPYTPGEDLSAYTKPIWRDTQMPRVDLSLRFWNDGTPRLTAYEYQGLLMSKDYQKGDLTCLSCHTMHGGDPRGMITAEKRGPAACASCHAEIVRNPAPHTRHAAGSSGSDCYACHMPKITYGLLDVHPTHRIQVPDPSRAWKYEMPEACTLCHTNRSARWAADAMKSHFERSIDAPPSGAEFDVAENLRAMFGGDVVQRSVAIMALGDERSYASRASARVWAIPLLIEALNDRYPAVRHFAYRALVQTAGRHGRFKQETMHLPQLEPLASDAERAEVVERWRSWWSAVDKRALEHPGAAVPLTHDFAVQRGVLDALIARQQNKIISIGE